MKRKLLYSIMLLILVLATQIFPGISTAQSESLPIHAIAQTPQGITFYGLSNSYAIEPIYTLPTTFAFEEFNASAEWLIAGLQYVGVAPDGQHVAFIVRHGGESVLFLYQAGATTFQQIAVSSPYLEPIWSPTGDAILLRAPYPFLPGWVGEAFPDNFVYDLATASVVPITRTPDELEKTIRWTIDGTRILYENRADGNLYTIGRDGSGLLRLTDPGFDYESYTFNPDLCRPAFLSLNQRWYFTEGCRYAIDQTQDQVFSVGANREDTRLELSLPEMFPEDGIFYRSVIDIYTTEASVYVVAGVGSGAQETEGWYVLRLGTMQSVDVVYELHFDEQVDLITASISPEGQRIALVGYTAFGNALLSIGDLVTGDTIIEVESPDGRLICDPRWLDPQTLLYEQTDRDCFRYEPDMIRQVWLYDFASARSINLSETLTGPISLIPWQ